MIPDEIARCGEEQERISGELQANPSEGAKRGIEDWIAEEVILRANPSEVAAGLGIPAETVLRDLERNSYRESVIALVDSQIEVHRKRLGEVFSSSDFLSASEEIGALGALFFIRQHIVRGRADAGAPYSDAELEEVKRRAIEVLR
jgi:hypothetical protein